MRTILSLVACAVIAVVIDLAAHHFGSEADGSSSLCTSNSCIVQDLDKSLTGGSPGMGG